jgi:hypothetical protein
MMMMMMAGIVPTASTQEPNGFLPRNLTQTLGLPNYTSQYGSGLAQDLRGQIFLFTGNPAVSPLIETMAYAQIPNFNLPVNQIDPRNHLNTSIDSLFNAPILQYGTVNNGVPLATTGAGNIGTANTGQTSSFFVPASSTSQNNPAQAEQTIAGLQNQVSQLTALLNSLLQGTGGQGMQQQQTTQSLISPLANRGMGQQQATLHYLTDSANLTPLTSTVDISGQQPFASTNTTTGSLQGGMGGGYTTANGQVFYR